MVHPDSRAALLRQPFDDEQPMVGPPPCSEKDFARPLLRRCPFDFSTISWIARLDGGFDGYAWKVGFGDQGPFVLKVVRRQDISPVTLSLSPPI